MSEGFLRPLNALLELVPAAVYPCHSNLRFHIRRVYRKRLLVGTLGMGIITRIGGLPGFLHQGRAQIVPNQGVSRVFPRFCSPFRNGLVG